MTKEEVCRQIHAAIGEYDELLTMVKKRNLRPSAFARTILQGTVERRRRRGKQKKWSHDTMIELTAMDFTSSTTAADNRTRWKRIVAKTSVVPRRPSKVIE